MPEGIGSLVYPYSSWNEAYRKFRDEYKYLNTFSYLFLTGKDNLQEHLKAQIAKNDEGKVERGEPLDYAMGVVTHAYSRSKFKGVHVARSDRITLSVVGGRLPKRVVTGATYRPRATRSKCSSFASREKA